MSDGLKLELDGAPLKGSVAEIVTALELLKEAVQTLDRMTPAKNLKRQLTEVSLAAGMLTDTFKAELPSLMRTAQDSGKQAGKSYAEGVRKGAQAAKAEVQQIAKGIKMEFEGAFSPYNARTVLASELKKVQQDTAATYKAIYRNKVKEANRAAATEKSELEAFSKSVERDTAATYKAIYRNKVKEAKRAAAEIAAIQKATLESSARATVNQATRAAAGSYSVWSPNSARHGTVVDPTTPKTPKPASSGGVRELQRALKDTERDAARARMTLQGFGTDLNEMHSAARGVASGFNAMWLTWGSLAPLLAGAAVSNAFVQTVKQGAQINDTMTRLRVLGGESAESVASLNEQMLELSRSGPKGPREIAEAMKTLRLAGLDVAEVSASIKDVMNFSLAGDTTLEQSAEAMTTIATAFNVASSDFNYIADTVSKAAAESKASIESMAEAMKTASVVHQQYGVTLEDTAVGLSLLANAGIQGSSAGTALRNMYVDLAGRTEKVSKRFKQLGVETLDVNGKMRSQADIFRDLIQSLSEKETPAGATRILQEIFSERGSKEAIAIFNALTKQAKDAGDDVASVYDSLANKVRNAAGTAAIAASELALTPLNQMRSVQSTLQASLVETFDSLQPYLLELSVTLREAFSSDAFKGSLQDLVILVGNATRFLVEHGRAIATVVIGYQGLRAAVGLAGAVSAMTVVMQVSGSALATVAASSAGASAGLASVGVAATGATTAAAAGLTRVGVAARLAALANPILTALATVVTLGAAAWAMYATWTDKGADSAKKNVDLDRTEFLKNLQTEAQRLRDINEARERGITLEELQRSRQAGQVLNGPSESVREAQRQLQAAQDARAKLDRDIQGPWRETGSYKLRAGNADAAIADAQATLESAKEAEQLLRRSISAGIQDVQEQSRIQAEAERKRVAESAQRYAAMFKGSGLPELGGEGAGAAARARLGNELKEIQKRYSSELSVVENFTNTRKQVLDNAQRNEALSQGQFLAQELLQVESAEAQKLMVIEDYSQKFEAEARESTAKAQAALEKARAGGKQSEIDSATTAVENLSESVQTFRERLANDKQKLNDDLFQRTQEQANKAAGNLRKLRLDQRDYLKSEADRSSAADRQLALAERSLFLSDAQVAVLQAEAEERDRGAVSLEEYGMSIRDAQIALDDFVASFRDMPDEAWSTQKLEAYRAQVGALRAQLEALGAGREAAQRVTDENVGAAVRRTLLEDGLNHFKEVRNSVSDAIVTGLTDGGKAGRRKLRDLIVSELKKPVTLVVNALINPIVGALMGSMGLSTAAQAADTTQVLSQLSQLGSAGSLLAKAGVSIGAFGQGISTGFGGAMSGSTVSAAMGSPTAYSAGYYAAPVLGVVGGRAAGQMISGGYSAYGKSGNSAVNLGTAAGAAIGGTIGGLPGAALGALLGGISGGTLNRMFGRKTTSQGIEGTFSGDSFTGNAYEFQKGGWFRSDKTIRKNLDAGTSSEFTRVYSEAKSSVSKLAEDLGQGADTLEDFSYSVKINLKGLSEEKAAEKIAKEFEKMTEKMAEAALGTEDYTRNGETALETLERLGTHLKGVNAEMALLGHKLFDVSLAGADAANGLADLFGGLSEMQSATQSYFENFYTAEEQLKASTAALSETFEGLGETLPNTREEFRALVEQQDLSTDAGQEMYATLLLLAPAFDSIHDAAEETAEKLKEVATDILDYVKELSTDRADLATPLEKLQTTKQTYTDDLALAQAGDEDALGRITESAQDYIDAQKEVTASSSTTQATIDQIISQLTALGNGLTVPAFASGGYHAGGWAVVGEDGPELAHFDNPARIYNARQTSAMLGGQDMGEVVQQLADLNARISSLSTQQQEETRALINSNAVIQGRAADAVVQGVAQATDRQAWKSQSQPVIK